MNLDTITVRIDGDRIALDAKGAGGRVFSTLLLDPSTALLIAKGITDLLTEMGMPDNFTIAVKK